MPKEFYHVFFKNKQPASLFISMSGFPSGWICHLLLREFWPFLGSRSECGSQVLTRLLQAAPTLLVLGLQGSGTLLPLECFWDKNNLLLFTKGLWKPGGWAGFLIPGLQPELSHPGGKKGSLGWAEMVPDPSQWGWAWLEGLFGQFSHHVGALLEPFLCAGSGMWDVGQVTNWHWSWLPAVSSLPYPPEPPAVGRVGPQKPLKRGELFLLCRTQDFLNPWEKPSFSHPVSYPA